MPVVKDGRANPSAIRQISAGSILGMLQWCRLVEWSVVLEGRFECMR